MKLGTARVGLPSEGGDREEGSFLIGAANATSNVVAGFSWNNRDIVFERAFPWNAPNRGLSGYGNNWSEINATTGRPNTATGSQFSLAKACDFELYYTTTNPVNGTTPWCSYDFLKTNANDSSTGNQSAFSR
ncbi:hypothetical protein [Alishewanella longhuensis]